MEVALLIGYLALFIFIISKAGFFAANGISRSFIIGVFILKVAAGAAMEYIYSHYYTSRTDADIFRYFDDSKVLYESFFINKKHFAQMFFGIDTNEPYLYPYYNKMFSWDHRYSSIVTRVNAVFRFFSLGFYKVHVVFICFFSLAGLMGIYKVLSTQVTRYYRLLAIGVFLMPSTLFWASGVLKEAIVIFALGLFVYGFNKLLIKRTPPYLFQRGIDSHLKQGAGCLIVIFPLALLFLTKGYVIMAATPGLLAMVYCSKTKPGMPYWIIFTAFYTVGIILLFILPIHFAETVFTKQQDFLALANNVKAGSVLNNIHLQPTTWSVIKNIPSAFYNTLLRPSIFEMDNMLVIPSAIENAGILALLVLAIIKGRKKILAMPAWFYFCLFFFVTLFILIGLTVPVAGAIVRYKIPALPFLMGAILLMNNRMNLNFSTIE